MAEDLPENRDSRVELKISVGIELTRKRAIIKDQFETRLDAVGIAITAAIIVVFFIVFIVPKILSLF